MDLVRRSQALEFLFAALPVVTGVSLKRLMPVQRVVAAWRVT
jgi:hypothetical protein